MAKPDISALKTYSKALKLLYVEDNHEVREQTCKMLANFFDHITTATDGEDGWKKYQEDDFDLIITDINMPVLNGLEMLEKIRERDCDIVCIVISAHDETNHFTQSISLGVDGYLLKPIQIDSFLTLLYKSVKKIKLYRHINSCLKKR